MPDGLRPVRRGSQAEPALIPENTLPARVERSSAVDEYRLNARLWLEKNIPEAWRPESESYKNPDFDEQRQFERRLYAEAGLAGWTWPTEYGGQGLTIIEHLVGNEEIGRLAPPESLNGIGKEMAGPILLAIGTSEQKRDFVPKILTMEHIWCQGFSETEAGSDLAAVHTVARPSGGDWIIDGSKIWTSMADRADYCLLLARTGEAEMKHASLTLFAVPMKTLGVTARPIRQINDRSGFCEVFFDNVRVPANAVIGEVNGGWTAASKVLQIERAMNRMYRASRFENELRHLVEACRRDEGLGRMFATERFQQRLAGYFAELENLRRLVRATVTRLAADEPIGATGSMIKLLWSEPHQRFLEAAQELLSYAAAPLDPFIRRAIARFDDLYLRGRAEGIMAGATAVQLDVIASRILRLPKAV